MFSNILDYYKATRIYQHCSQLIHKKDIPCNLLFPHSVEFSGLCFIPRGRFDFQRAFCSAWFWLRESCSISSEIHSCVAIVSHKYKGIWLDKDCLIYGVFQTASNIIDGCNLEGLDFILGLDNHRKTSKLRLVINLNLPFDCWSLI